MANRFWVGGSGNWSDTAHWSTTTGGASGASVPTSADNAIFDALSNTTAYTVTVDVTANCLDLNFSAAPLVSGTITLAFGANYLRFYGNLTLLAGMLFTSTYPGGFAPSAGGSVTQQIQMNGVSMLSHAFTMLNSGSSVVKFMDAFTCSYLIMSTSTTATLDTNNQSVTINSVFNNFGGGILTLGSSTITVRRSAGSHRESRSLESAVSGSSCERGGPRVQPLGRVNNTASPRAT